MTLHLGIQGRGNCSQHYSAGTGDRDESSKRSGTQPLPLCPRNRKVRKMRRFAKWGRKKGASPSKWEGESVEGRRMLRLHTQLVPSESRSFSPPLHEGCLRSVGAIIPQFERWRSQHRKLHGEQQGSFAEETTPPRIGSDLDVTHNDLASGEVI